ncbi:hypothetical protein ACFY2W_19200 [Streptomyces sp. NPDC001262]|uniref:hypothetical protein n=1 Tax=Streptomyces sp. NPDC001262 TaxID=3364552 RepID=UPI0036C8F5F0
MAAKIETGASSDEYVTYAPPGYKCQSCGKAIKSLDPVRRVHIERVSGSPVVHYRHTGCIR